MRTRFKLLNPECDRKVHKFLFWWVPKFQFCWVILVNLLNRFSQKQSPAVLEERAKARELRRKGMNVGQMSRHPRPHSRETLFVAAESVHFQILSCDQ